jgi:hypothetical protein
VFVLSAGDVRSDLNPTVGRDVRTGLVGVGVRSSLIGRGTCSACDGAVRIVGMASRGRADSSHGHCAMADIKPAKACSRSICACVWSVCALIFRWARGGAIISVSVLDVIRLAHLLPATQLCKLGRSAQRPHLLAPDPARTQTQT